MMSKKPYTKPRLVSLEMTKAEALTLRDRFRVGLAGDEVESAEDESDDAEVRLIYAKLAATLNSRPAP